MVKRQKTETICSLTTTRPYGNRSIEKKCLCHLFLSFPSILKVLFVCKPSPLCVPLTLHYNHEDTTIEICVLLLQRTIDKIEVRKSASDIENSVELCFSERPLLSENAPQAFQSPEETFHDHPSPSSVVVLPTITDCRHVHLCPPVSQIGQQRVFAQHLPWKRRMRPQNGNVVNAAWERG